MKTRTSLDIFAAARLEPAVASLQASKKMALSNALGSACALQQTKIRGMHNRDAPTLQGSEMAPSEMTRATFTAAIWVWHELQR
jgi:hypothetical protein